MLLPIHGEVAAEPPEGLERISICLSHRVHNSLTTPGKDERCCKQISFTTKE